MDEPTVVYHINRAFGRRFELAEYKYSYFDAYDDDYIAEIKVRKHHYDDCMIEYDKYAKNVSYAKLNNVYFVYVVATKSYIYIFNISKMNDSNYNFKWSDRTMPKNTHFGSYDNKITKKVGYVNVNDSSCKLSL
jgi:hypothetical protein